MASTVHVVGYEYDFPTNVQAPTPSPDMNRIMSPGEISGDLHIPSPDRLMFSPNLAAFDGARGSPPYDTPDRLMYSPHATSPDCRQGYTPIISPDRPRISPENLSPNGLGDSPPTIAPDRLGFSSEHKSPNGLGDSPPSFSPGRQLLSANVHQKNEIEEFMDGGFVEATHQYNDDYFTGTVSIFVAL